MHHPRKIRWPRLTRSQPPSSSQLGKSRKDDDCEHGLQRNLNVNEEYNEVFRTQSYMDIWSKVEGEMKSKPSIDRASSSTSSLPLFVHLSDHLLEPSQDVAIDLIQSSTLHALLSDYFNCTLQASNLCELLLQSIHGIRSNYRSLNRGIKNSNSSNQQVREATLAKEFASFALRGNPLSAISAAQFSEIHNRLSQLLLQLTSRRRKIKRKMKLARFCKKFFGYTLMISCSVLAIALLVLVIHSIIGLIGAPGMLMACSSGSGSGSGITRKRLKISRATWGKLLERLCEQLDVAARGIFIMINQFDTMGRLVARLEHEVEHKKNVVEMCVKNYKRSRQVSREAVRELENHEAGFLEELDELEKHVFLCFLTINRSRRLVTQQLLAPLNRK